MRMVSPYIRHAGIRVRMAVLGSLILGLACASVFAQAPDGPEFRVNTFTPDAQYGPALANHESGGFVGVWTSWQQFGSGGWIQGRRYDARGVPIGSEFRVSTAGTGIGTQHQPAVASDRSGGFMVVWAAYAPFNLAIFGQRFDPGGARVGAEVRYTPAAAPDQSWPRIAPMRDGGFLLVWTCSDTQDYDVCGRPLSPSGTAIGSEFRVNADRTGFQGVADIARESDGGFVVVWQSNPGTSSSDDIAAQRLAPDLTLRGSQFRVNDATTGSQRGPGVAADGRGGFTVVWETYANRDIFARRYSGGVPQGTEFLVNGSTIGGQMDASVSADDAGNFVVAWSETFYSAYDVHVKRFLASGAPRGAEFVANSYTPGRQLRPVAVSDKSGNLVLSWDSWPQDAGTIGVYARRYGGLRPDDLQIVGGVNGIVEVPSAFTARTAWRNDSLLALAFQGHVTPTIPSGLALALDADADYGTTAPGSAAFCAAPCYAGMVTGQRPLGHVDLHLDEWILPDVQGQTKRWPVHVGGSFVDAPASSPYYRYIETVIHEAVTGGCTPTAYCPAAPATREQMATFVLTAREGSGYAPAVCATPMFSDVPASSPFCRWIEELALRGVVTGCGGGAYCPQATVSREELAVFVLATREPGFVPPACAAPMFSDVPASSPFCRWIEELARRGVVAGCGGGAYCPTAAVTREQMAVFLSVTFGLRLYGP